MPAGKPKSKSPWTSGFRFPKAGAKVKVAPPIPKEPLRAIADAAAAVVPITKVPAVNQSKSGAAATAGEQTIAATEALKTDLCPSKNAEGPTPGNGRVTQTAGGTSCRLHHAELVRLSPSLQESSGVRTPASGVGRRTRPNLRSTHQNRRA
jgi:hypothetical protein